MNKNAAIKAMTTYLKSHNIECCKVIEEGGTMMFVMSFSAPNAPGQLVESCVWFYESDMEVRCYYSASGAEWVKNSGRINELLQLLNFINARVIMASGDGFGGRLYKPSILYTPRFYLTADDGFDVSMTTIIPYDFFELAPLETEDYVTAFSPQLLDKLSFPIFETVLGQITPAQAIFYIQTEILHDEGEIPAWLS